MAENEKKSFVLYFDAFENIAPLPLEQKGELLAALFQYAMDAAAGTGTPEGELARHPGMSPDTRMAFSFIAGTIRRDTEKWHAKHRRYRDAALRRLWGVRSPREASAGRDRAAPPETIRA